VVLKDSFQIHPYIAGWGLGRGESEVITYAMVNAGYETVLDDLEARKCAATFNIPVRETVGVILRAKKKYLIPAAKPLIENLKDAGLRFNDEWIKEASTWLESKLLRRIEICDCTSRNLLCL
jgi:predicted nucleic acid-binding protein